MTLPARLGHGVVAAQLWLMSRPALHVAVFAGAFFLLFAGWGLFLPLASSPDESAHYIYSAAVVRGQSGMLDVVVPARIASVHDLAACLAFQIDVTASCQTEFRTDSNADVATRTHVGLYNPVFYAWTGLGSLLIPTENGMYVARLLAALVNAGVIGWATSLLIRTARSRWTVTGLLILITPMVVYMCSVLNPNGLEIVATLAIVVGGWNLIVRRPTRGRWTESHSIVLIAGALLLVSRGLSPLIAALVLTALAICAGWTALRDVLAQRTSWVLLAPLVLIGVLSLLWILSHGTNYVGVVPPDSLSEGIASIPVYYDLIDGQLNQVVGQLGWLDLPAPHLVVFGWLAAAAAFVFVSFLAAAKGERVTLVLATATCILLPGVLSGIQWSGQGWQGRYTLPYVVALLAIAALSAGDRMATPPLVTDELSRRAQRVAAIGAPWGFLLAHVWIMLNGAHRYLLGNSAPLWADPAWRPPLSLWLLAALIGVGLLLVTTLVSSAPRPLLARERR
ncbi:DUF2142 domain-containing protein [Microbacterium sp. zg.Y625]|uniref:DUF2142 domain-containing protein n=1 Tax=Microbacterium jiangjiandongii TaxID=3049071 RepID=UPI00214CDE1B|nr:MULTISPECIES: DUF2142 domain-containing protein [unclassified Microbacterium]MCR2793752.1 DUF2142 domain-containing protein [Microbacterium sp. zg.Y625]WIM26096.1 DUF2142 domain-containing protein [Microbacterium sp. zg-Y625]